MYIQTDLSSQSDSAELLAYDIHNVVPDLKLSIKVRPRLQRAPGPLRAVLGGSPLRLPLSALDAGALASLTDSDPLYLVTRPPKYGFLHRLSHAGGGSVPPRVRRKAPQDSAERRGYAEKRAEAEELGSSAVFSFTHSDLVHQRVEYELNADSGLNSIQGQGSLDGVQGQGSFDGAQGQGWGSQEDSFEFVLTALNAQPVSGRVDIDIVPHEGFVLPTQGLSPLPPAHTPSDGGGRVSPAQGGAVGGAGG